VAEDEHPTVAVGDVLHVSDRVSRFSKKKSKRWCIVVEVTSAGVRLAFRSASRKEGVKIPMEAMDEFDKDGWVSRDTLRISHADAARSRNIGPIDEHYLKQILFIVSEELF
jgi:hypothetical protein